MAGPWLFVMTKFDCIFNPDMPNYQKPTGYVPR